MRILRYVLSMYVAMAAAGCVCSQVVSSVLSPDRLVRLDILQRNGQLGYQLFRGAEPIIDPSAIRWTVNDTLFGTRTDKVMLLRKGTRNTTYPTRGTHSLAVNKSNDILYKITSSGAPAFMLEARVFNDGVAFRYIMDRADKSEVNDFTTFVLPVKTTIWSQGDIQYYEGMYRRQDVDSLKIKQLAGPPVVIGYPRPGLYAAITEGGLYDFAGMALQVSGQRTFQAKLSGKTIKTGRIETPWRIIMTGNLNALVNTDIITNVSEPPDKELFKDASSWIKPGLSVWSWLTEFNVASGHKVTFEDMKKFSKWAGELGIPYNLVDAGWGHWREGDKDCWAMMKELVEYSAGQHVKIWLWKAYPDMDGIEGIDTPEKRKTFMKKCRDIGIVGMKIDFFNNEGQEITKFYHDALKDGAEYKLMLDFHGANKPTGISRSFPNEMSREGIQGNEYGANNSRATTLPFTRLLAGHGDYTPLFLARDLKGDTSWDQRYNREMMGGTSWCYQIATALIFSSPLLCLSVNPVDVLNNPEKEFIASMPVIWDETIVLPPSEIGEMVLMARRSGRDWYITGLTQKAQTGINVNLSFLKKGRHSAHIIRDDPDDQTHLISEDISVTANQHLPVYMNANGGFIAKITPE